MSEACIFCKIIAGEAPAKIVYLDEEVTAFNDIHPIAPVHILIVPNRHIESVNQLDTEDEIVIGWMTGVGRRLAAEHGLSQSGYRLVINTGPDARQSVYHLHMHLIGGRVMPFRFD